LKFDHVTIVDAEGERDVELSRLPIRLGTGNNCEVRVPGPGSDAVALLDELDGEPFVQPVGTGAVLTVNEEPLRTSRKLAAGDVIGFFGTQIVIEGSGGTLTLKVQLEGSAYVTRPPEMPVSSADAAEETIVATAFQRAADTAPIEIKTSGIRWEMVVGGVIAVLALVSWLLFTSKSIQFEVQPAGADEVSVSGGWFQLPVGERLLLREGNYTVHVRKQGYYDVDQTIEIDESPSRTIVVEMRKLPGQLTVVTDPAVDAIVTVDDSRVGTAPYGPLEVEPGTHSISVQADRFLPFTQRLSVPGLGLQQTLEVQLVPLWADVEISSNPSGAVVYRGTEVIGETPLSLELMEGSHSLSMIKDGFAASDFSVDTEANVDLVLPTVQLEPADAKLLVSSIPRSANVTVDGRYHGQSPVTVYLSPGVDYQIGLSKAGYGSTTRQVRLQAATSREITVDLTARTGEVTVQVLPGDATIYIDGQARGTGNVTLKLSSAPHQLEVRRDGYVSQAREVVPRPGYPQNIRIRLLSNAELAAQSTANTMTTSQGQELRRVEAGSFSLGTSRREQGRQANEVIVPVTITKPFFIGVKEVTNREFRRFRPNHDSGGATHIALNGDLNPVANVTWDDTIEYLNWLSAQEGLTPAYEKVFERWQPVSPTPNGYRLPTEAEWVWAIRYAGRPNAATFPWGDRLPPRPESGNWAGRSANELVRSLIPGWDDGYASTAPVGTFRPNAIGIFDGGGNVAEWVQDYYSVPTPGRTDAVNDPQGPPRGSNRVIRGSSWGHAGIRELRHGFRNFGSSSYWDVGFRIARNVE
jgi:formylglycine-generating enzyme required for sulfatase activity